MTTIILDSPAKLDRFCGWVRKLDLSRPWRVDVDPFRARRSLGANARLWALHTLAGDAVGCSAYEMHEDMLCKFFGYTEIKMPSGIIRQIPLERSSTKDTKKFREFMEKVEAFYISELGVWLE